MEPHRLVVLPDGRRLAVDQVGDPDGHPVLLLHGTPDSRLSRHPDDALTAACGVRLIAVDRPGCGRSDAHPGRRLASVADDLAELCAQLGLDEVGVLAWSAGAPYGAALAAQHPALVRAMALVAPLVPIEAYDDPALRAGAGPGRAMLAEMAEEMSPEAVAEEIVPYLLPDPATAELVAAQQAETDDEWRRAELAAIPGAQEALVAATVESVATGRQGLLDDIATQVTRSGLTLSSCSAPTRVWCGERDAVAPTVLGRWWAEQLPAATVTVVPDASHTVLLSRWAEILGALTA